MNFQVCKRAVIAPYAKADGQAITDLPALLIENAGKHVSLASHREGSMSARENAYRKLYASVPVQQRKCVPTYQRNSARTHLPVQQLVQA